MEKNEKQNTSHSDFSEIMKKAYMQATSDQNITVKQLLEELKDDLKLIYK